MEGIHGHIHPLQDPLILEHIFKGLDGCQLMKCRQVCRAWRLGSAKAMRAAVKIVTNSDDGDEGCWGMSAFLELVQNEWSTFSESPFANTFELTNGVAKIPEFWTILGIHIKSLHFSEFKFPSAEILLEIILQSCPNLEYLNLTDVEVCGKRPSQPTDWIPLPNPNKNLKSLILRCLNGYIPWLPIFHHFPSVEELIVNMKKSQEINFYKQLGIHRLHAATFWELEKLQFSFVGFYDPHVTIRLFAEGDHALKDLKIKGIERPEHITATQQILASHAATLKKISFTASGNLEDDIFPLPNHTTLENVEDLRIECFPRINPIFLMFVPNLKKLNLRVGGFQGDFSMMRDVVFPICTHLEVMTHKKSEFKKLCRWLPYLEVLDTSYTDNRIFAVICKRCPNLRSLCLTMSSVDDCGITGLDEEDVERINREGVKGTWRPTTVPRANLSSLERLQKFKWSWTTKPEYLDYCAAVCGVQKLPQLKHLNVHKWKCSEVGRKMWEKLHAQYPWDGDGDLE